MKINLIDDTALIETTSIKNVPKKERTILGLRHNALNSTNVREETINTTSQKPMRMIRRASAVVNNKKRCSSSLHVCGNARMSQENGNVKFQENGNVKFHVDVEKGRLMGFTEEVKIQEYEDEGGLLEFKNIQENGEGHIGQEIKFQENDDVGCRLKKQERYKGNGFEEEAKSTRNYCRNGVENITGNEKGMLGFDTNQEKNGKTIQVWVARGKVQDKYETTFKDEKVSTNEMVEVQFKNGIGKNIVGTMISYSRKQMEDLRFVNMEDQNKKWGVIYCELGPAVKKEYDGLLDCNRHNSQLSIKKKVTAPGILGSFSFGLAMETLFT